MWMLIAGLLIVGVPLGVAILRQNDKWSQEILSAWIRRHGYRLHGADYRVFRLGPFTWTSGRGHAVYYVSVIESNGTHRRGWVRLSYPISGVADSDSNVEVKWEK